MIIHWWIREKAVNIRYDTMAYLWCRRRGIRYHWYKIRFNESGHTKHIAIRFAQNAYKAIRRAEYNFRQSRFLKQKRYDEVTADVITFSGSKPLTARKRIFFTDNGKVFYELYENFESEVRDSNE